MIYRLFLVTCMMVAVNGVAQQLTLAEKTQSLQSVATGNSMFRSFDERYKGVKGGVTLFERYVDGQIFFTNGKIVAHGKVNYDAYTNELIVFHNNLDVIVSENMVNHFVLKDLHGDTLRFDKLIAPGGKVGYFQAFFGGRQVRLYKQIYKRLIEPDYKGAYSTGRDYAEFVTEQKFLVLKEGVLTEIKNKKSINEIFPSQREATEHFIKAQKISFKDENDLLKLVGYVDEISR